VSTQIFVNLPVKDLRKSIAFFTKLGFTFNPQFTNENATCMIIGENIFAMLLVEKFFQTFTKKAICDATKSIEVLVCISRESRADVDNMAKNAAAAGGTIPRPAQDHGFMYTHAFEDIDGHTWELTYMAPTADTKA
jgi:uncharacterized protein